MSLLEVNLQNSASNKQSPLLLTRKSAACLLGISVASLDRLRKKNKSNIEKFWDASFLQCVI